MIKVVQASLSASKGNKLGLGISNFTSHFGEGGHLAFLRCRGYTEKVVCKVRYQENIVKGAFFHFFLVVDSSVELRCHTLRPGDFDHHQVLRLTGSVGFEGR